MSVLSQPITNQSSLISQHQYQSFIRREIQSLQKLSWQKQKIKSIIKANEQLSKKTKDSSDEILALKKLISEKDKIINSLQLALKQQKERARDLENELKCERTFGLEKYEKIQSKYMKGLQIQREVEQKLHEDKDNLQKDLQELKAINEELKMKLQTNQDNIQQMTELIQKQNNTLREQDKQCNEMFLASQEQEEIIKRMYQEYHEIVAQNQLKESSLKLMNQQLQDLTSRMSKKNEDWNLLMEIEKIRLGMRTLQKNQLDKIESLIYERY